MTDELCECGKPKGHGPPTYKAPSFVVEYADGRKVQTSVATRWGSHAARAHGMPEVSSCITDAAKQDVSVQQEVPVVVAEKEEPKHRKVLAKRATKAPKTPEGQGSLF